VDSVSSQAITDVESRRLSREKALARAVTRVEASLPPGVQPGARPVFLILSGLPGSGKSVLARRLQPQLPAAIVETDHVRRLVFRLPRYTDKESAWVYAVSHALIERLLCQGRSVIFDATNLVERNRSVLYRIAERCQSRMVIVRTVAPESVIEERMLRRSQRLDANDRSDADIAVYLKLRQTEQAIAQPHLVIDTTQNSEESVRRILSACQE
jgi:predicted kinase